MPNKDEIQAMLGKAFFRLLTLSRRVAAGKWVMAILLTSGRTIG
jgi:hypothetical protein